MQIHWIDFEIFYNPWESKPCPRVVLRVPIPSSGYPRLVQPLGRFTTQQVGGSSKWRHFSGIFVFLGFNFSLLVFFCFIFPPTIKPSDTQNIHRLKLEKYPFPKAHQFLKVYFNNIRFQGSSIVGYRMYRQLIQPISNLNNFFGDCRIIHTVTFFGGFQTYKIWKNKVLSIFYKNMVPNGGK